MDEQDEQDKKELSDPKSVGLLESPVIDIATLLNALAFILCILSINVKSLFQFPVETNFFFTWIDIDVQEKNQ